jgi:hypothetical protein
VFVVLLPLPVVVAAVDVRIVAVPVSSAVFVLADVYGTVGKGYLGNLCGLRVEIRLELSAFSEGVLSFTPFLVFEVVSFVFIAIFIFVDTWSVFQSSHKASLEEEFVSFVKFPLSVE